jgi:SAM-dependent methyltransferase
MRYNDCELFECECSMIFMDPPPTAETLGAIYDSNYSGTPYYLAKAGKKMYRMRHRARLIERAVRSNHLNKPLRFLDIGCSAGFMVEAARERGFEAVGVEPDHIAVEYARTHFPNNTYFTGLLETVDLGSHRFDVVYCSEVIEHSADCNAFMTRLAQVMNDGGLLYLTTPDISHWRRPRDVTKWDGFRPPGHCLFFSPATLENLLKRHGFTVLRRSFALKPGIKLFAQKLPAKPA